MPEARILLIIEGSLLAFQQSDPLEIRLIVYVFFDSGRIGTRS